MADDSEGFDAAMDRVDRGWADIGTPDARHLNNLVRAESLWRLGRRTDAVEVLRHAKVIYDREGETGSNSTITSVLATYLAETGRFDDADELAGQASA